MLRPVAAAQKRRQKTYTLIAAKESPCPVAGAVTEEIHKGRMFVGIEGYLEISFLKSVPGKNPNEQPRKT